MGVQVPFKPYIVVTTLRLMVLLTISGVKLFDVTPVTTPFWIVALESDQVPLPF